MKWIAIVLGACASGAAPSAPSPGPATAGSAAGPAAPAPTKMPAPETVPVAAPAPPDAGAPDPGIVDWPIAWSDERAQLTLDYRRAHDDPAARDLEITPRMIVLHYTSGHSAKGTHDYFDRTRLEASRTELARGGPVNVSSHFLVDRDGTIYRLQPETRMARHTIGLNGVAIGVENVGDPPKLPLTDAQVAADAALVRYLVAQHPTITHVIGHSESMKFIGTDLWRERDAKYRNEKPDPGDQFMRDVRAKIVDLKLAGPPEKAL
ncbi:MAG TPA: peptidoglycan recognition family protein [Kofleriaceae bacterium]|nr:peptidoglycan recognition family protein [Kofleriaceae bacterium]